MTFPTITRTIGDQIKAAANAVKKAVLGKVHEFVADQTGNIIKAMLHSFGLDDEKIETIRNLVQQIDTGTDGSGAPLTGAAKAASVAASIADLGANFLPAAAQPFAHLIISGVHALLKLGNELPSQQSA